MMKRLGIVLGSLVLAAGVAAPHTAAAADPTYVTAGAGGTYPTGTTFSGLDVQGVELAVGSTIGADGSGLGNFTAVLRAATATGVFQPVSVEGRITSGARNAANVAVVTGLASLDMGDGLPAAPDIPFTATLVRDPATAQGTVALVIGSAELPAAALNEGSVSIQTVPAEPLEEPSDPVTVAAAGQ
jgi:hypothetical protein